MHRKLSLIALIIAVAARCAWSSVTVQASVSGVQKGGSITFTATTDESDTVAKVTFSYEGTGGTDVITSAPYQVTKVMSWATMQALTVTATFDFENIPDQQGTVDVDVVDITLSGPWQPLRGSTSGYAARTSPTGLAVSSWSWSYTNNVKDANWTDTANSDDQSLWRGTMVVSGTVQVGASILGINCTKSASVSVRSRTGGVWATPVACAEDNEPNWGAPMLDIVQPLGEIRDKDSNLGRIIVPQTNQNDWSDGVTLTQIASGPNQGVWYVQSNALEIDLETVINRFIKSGAPPPEPGATNFYDYNDDANTGCIANNMANFVQAVRNHEYRGTPSTACSLEGHFGRIEYALSNIVGDPAAAIEGHTAASQSALRSLVNTTLQLAEADLWTFTDDACDGWADDGPNWGGTGSLGSGKHTRYDIYNSQYYDGCTFGPEKF
jgi:hypothetical protein